MFRLFRVNRDSKPDLLEYYNTLPKISAKFKEEIREKYGSGAFYLQEYGKNTKKNTFAIEGTTQKNGENHNMDMTTLLSLVKTLEEINIRTRNIEKKLDELFEEGEDVEEKPETNILSSLGLSGDQAAQVASLASANPELAKALQTLQGLGGLK